MAAPIEQKPANRLRKVSWLASSRNDSSTRESINKANVITIALNPKEYYERFDNHSDNKKHKGLKKSTHGMDFDSYSSRLADLNKFSKEFFKKPKKIKQKRFQIINESMQMKAVIKVQFGQLNNKRFHYSNGLMSLPYDHRV